jgi:putative colanic acid biosynthesis UDP-glucose lipid carrier transferase
MSQKSMSLLQSQQIKSQENWPQLLMKVMDSFAIVVGLFVLIRWIPEVNSKSTIVIGLISIGLFNMVAEFMGLYRRWQGVAFEREVTCTMIAWSITFLLLAALGQLSLYSTEISGPALLIWFMITPVLSLSGRMISRWARRWQTDRGINTRNYAVVGITNLGIQLVRNIDGTPDLGLKFLGYYDDRPDDRTEILPADLAAKLGMISDLVQSAKLGQVDVIFVALPMRAEERVRKLVQELADSTVSVYIVPDLFVFQLLHSRWSDVQGIPIVSVFENPFYGVDGILKRGVDIALASVALAVSVIPMLLIAIAVKLTTRGPVLFRQLRYGLDGREIRVWKFRSMTVCEDGAVVAQATKNDPRVTKIGGFLRRTSLDELPQIFNVLFGQMSLVGPRPHANAHNEFYRKQIEGYMLRHKVKPGITGLAQVNGCRGETETLDKMENRILFDHQYIREWTVWLDFKILLKTFRVVFSEQNAY